MHINYCIVVFEKPCSTIRGPRRQSCKRVAEKEGRTVVGDCPGLSHCLDSLVITNNLKKLDKGGGKLIYTL